MRVADAVPADVTDFLSRPTRQCDIDEWVLGRGRPLTASLMEAVTHPWSNPRALLTDDGRCLSIWGVTRPDLKVEPWGLGYVWLIASEEAVAAAKDINALWPQEVALMHTKAATLRAVAYARNHLHLRWLRIVGFKEMSRITMPITHVEYVVFERETRSRPSVP